MKYELTDRLRSHIIEPTNEKMLNWFTNIDYVPNILPIMKNVPIGILNYAEKKAINFYKNKTNLLNVIYNNI